MSADKPLSGPQERALIRLAQIVDRHYPRRPRCWSGGANVGRTNTLDSLVRRELAEGRARYGSIRYGYEYRITDAGLSLCNSMGD